MAEKDDGKTPTESNLKSAKETEDLVDSEKSHVGQKLEGRSIVYNVAALSLQSFCKLSPINIL